MSQSTQSSPAPSRRERILIIGLIVLGLILIGFFGFRAVRSFLRIQLTGLEPGVTDVELIRGWMTIPYIATAYGVPEEYIFEQIGVPQEGNQDKGLYRLNLDYFEGEPEAILKVVQEAIRQYQAEHPPPREADHD
ncbi:MAG TPA: hypothetical protein VEC93_17115 [Anaerolineae bacterium]|nr:hypothetical protein [Anaerolineae bacterium]